MSTQSHPMSFRTPESLREIESIIDQKFLHNPLAIEGVSDLNDPVARRAAEMFPARAALMGQAVKGMVMVEHGKDEGYELLAASGEMLQLLNNIDAYATSEQMDKDLWEHQPGVFEDIASTLNEHDLTKGFFGYIEMPMSTGKTALYTRLAEAVAGKNTEGRLKTIVLTPSDLVQDQVVGKHEGKGFALLGEDTNVKVSGKTKEGYKLDGDVDVLNYQVLKSDKIREAIKAKGPKLIICDEAHRAIGKKTAEFIREIGEDAVVIGLTATAEYAANHHVANLFPVVIHEMSFKEAGEMGITQPVRIRIKATDVEVDLDRQHLTYSESDYMKLADIKARNLMGAKDAAKLVEQGRQGIINCLPGNDRYHAKHMAKLTSQQIIRQEDGTTRFVKAQYVDGTMSKRELNDILDAYDRGEIDVLTYVSLLGEGWDQSKTTFLVNMRPTDSPVLAKQRIGRVMRKNGTDTPNIVIDYIDNVKKLQYTGIEAFDLGYSQVERLYEQGELVDPTNPHKAVVAPWMSVEFENATSRTIYDQVVRGLIKPVPEGHISIREASMILGTAVTSIYRVINQAGFSLERYRGTSGHIGFYIPPEEFAEIATRLDADFGNSEDDLMLGQLAEYVDMDRAELRQLIIDNGVEPSNKRGVIYYYDKNAVKHLADGYKNGWKTTTEGQSSRREEADKGYIATEEGNYLENLLITYPQISARSLLLAVKELEIQVSAREVSGGRRRHFIDSRSEERLMQHVSNQRLPIPEGWIEFDQFMEKQLGIDLPKIRSALQFVRNVEWEARTFNVTLKESKEFIKIPKGNVKLFKEEIKKFFVPKGYVAKTTIGERYGLRGTAVGRFLGHTNIRSELVRSARSGNYVDYLNEEDTAKEVETRRDVEDAKQRGMSLDEVATRFNLNPSIIAGALNSSKYRVPTRFYFVDAAYSPATPNVKMHAVEWVKNEDLLRLIENTREYSKRSRSR